MAEPQKCTFFLLRYVPDPIKNEFVNIGLVLLPAAGMPQLRFTRDWSRVRCLDPQADLELLESVQADLESKLRHGEADREMILRTIEDSFSNGLEASDSKACIAESPMVEADELARIYLDRPSRRQPAKAPARIAILNQMRHEFQSAGVWDLMEHPIHAADFTIKGDPMKIDCGYGNGSVKMFHALAPESDPNASKLLAFTFPRLAEGILRKDGRRAELTAIVADDLPREDESTLFALKTLAEQSIGVATLAQMTNIAAQAAKDLGIS